MNDPRLERWLDELLATPGLTAIRDRGKAWSMLVADALRGAALVGGFEGPVVDVGSGGGSPGIPLAAALPGHEVTLLEANAHKARFLERAAASFPNVTVVRGRAEEQETDSFGVAVAKALALPPVALEWAWRSCDLAVRRFSGSVRRRTSSSWREWPVSLAEESPRNAPVWLSYARSRPLRRVSPAAPAWPGNVLSPD